MLDDFAALLHPVVREVTERVAARSVDSRTEFLARIAASRSI